MNIFRMTEAQHRRLHDHLIDGSGMEAIAVGLCGRGSSAGRELLTVHEIVEIPHDECERLAVSVQWPTRRVRNLLARAKAEGLAVFKIHSHPGGYRQFSAVDDASDQELFSAVGLKVSGEHLSAVMLPDGEIFGRRMDGGTERGAIDRVAVIGDEVRIWPIAGAATDAKDFDVRHRQAFGDRTINLLSTLTVAIVGISGTGSPTAEMLARLGVARLILIDPDVVEAKNLNRIWGARRDHVEAKLNKAQMMKVHIEAMGLGTVVDILEDRIDTPEGISLLSTCDFAFGCVDSIEGRDALNRIATFYTLPYIDMGVRLDADGSGGVSSVSAGVHYLKPGGSSLKSRGVYSDAELYSEYLKRTDPDFYQDQVRRGYIHGVNVDRPAVISINAAVAAAAVNEMLARLHPFRTAPNANFAIQKLLFTHGRIALRPDGRADVELAAYVGRGDSSPLLMSPRMERAA
jgi:hypothetical protein